MRSERADNADSEYITPTFKSDAKVTKIKRYRWKIIDSMGDLEYIDKHRLLIDETYQRKASRGRILDIARDWSWLACGVIIVANRGGNLYVVDGQHRVLASYNRSDISALPCVVFHSDSTQEEAEAWISANTHRRMPTSFEKFKALKESGDADAMYLQNTLDKYKIKLTKHGGSAMEMKSIQCPLNILKKDPERFDKLFALIAELCIQYPINEWLIAGIGYIGQSLDLSDGRLHDRFIKIGPDRLTKAAKEASAYYRRGGPKVWGNGILKELNYGLRQRFYVDNFDGWALKDGDNE